MFFRNPQILNTISFKGYDARPLKGFVMNSNYAGIAEEMKKIGDQEDFDVFLFQGTLEHPNLVSSNFRRPRVHAGCWAQDMWGIVKKTLLSCENSEKQQLLLKKFGLKENPEQKRMRNKIGLYQLKDFGSAKSEMILPRDKKFQALPEQIKQSYKTLLNDDDSSVNREIFYKLCKQSHLKGGNYYITKGQDGDDEVLIGSNELKKFTREQLTNIFQTDKIHIIPQADFHLDLFIRPLADKKVLIADDELTLKVLSEGYKKMCDMLSEAPESEYDKIIEVICNMGNLIDKFKFIVEKNPYSKLSEVENKLIEAGYKPIKVPGRVFELESANGSCYLSHLQNYMNANVQINKKGEIVYITNKSTLDEMIGLTEDIQKLIGFSLENEFLKVVKQHVDKVYFVSGQNNELPNSLLKEYLGGIHCMSMEIPNCVEKND